MHHDTATIELRVAHAGQLLVRHEATSFRAQRIDDEATAWLLDAVRAAPRGAPLRVVIRVVAEADDDDTTRALTDAVRAQMTWERERVQRQLQAHARSTRFQMTLGAVLLVGFLSLAEVVSVTPVGHLRQIVREGLVIMGWVALWRPLEALLYDWWPLVASRRAIDRVLHGELSVRYGDG